MNYEFFIVYVIIMSFAMWLIWSSDGIINILFKGNFFIIFVWGLLITLKNYQLI
jgi:hypothetical protein